MLRNTHVLLIIVFLLLPCSLFGQLKVPSGEVGITTLVSDGRQAPFWLMSNRQGKFLPENQALALEVGLFAGRETEKKFDMHYGLEVFGRQGKTSDIWLHQAYAGVTLYDLVEVRAGMWEEIIGSREPRLSTGSIIWSGNARPMPKVQINTPGYIKLPFTNGYVEVKGLLSHGWFEKDRFVSNVYLHHKNAYLRLGGPLPVNFTYGFNHYGQWGGSSPLHDKPYPSDLDAYYRIFFNRSGDVDDPATPVGWAINKFGNTLGSRNYAIDYATGGLTTGVYYQDIFEDGSGLRRKNFPDGLWGTYLRFPDGQRFLQALVYEFLHTKDQSGPRHNDEEGNVVGGNDNYFNHGSYQSGWSYHGYTIGTPLITSPILNDPEYQRFTNNRVAAHHLGAEGWLGAHVQYRGLLTYSRNYGRHSLAFEEPLDQLSGMLELIRSLPWFGLDAGVTIAADKGRMYGNNMGVLLRLSKRY